MITDKLVNMHYPGCADTLSIQYTTQAHILNNSILYSLLSTIYSLFSILYSLFSILYSLFINNFIINANMSIYRPTIYNIYTFICHIDINPISIQKFNTRMSNDLSIGSILRSSHGTIVIDMLIRNTILIIIIIIKKDSFRLTCTLLIKRNV